MNLRLPDGKTVFNWLRGGTAGFWLFLILAFGGSMFWAKSWDRFHRIWFTIQTPASGHVDGIAVLPKPMKPRPVAVFMYGSGATLLTSGNVLRQLAEAEMAAVGIEYNKEDESGSEAQLMALLEYLPQQQWAKNQPIVWIGSSLGAQRMLSFALRHPQLQPDLMIRLAGGLVPELDSEPKAKPLLKCPVLLIHGEGDQVFPLEEAKKLAALLKDSGVSVELNVRTNSTHGLSEDRGVFFRVIGEYCQKHFAPGKPLQFLPEEPADGRPFWACITPAFAWVATWLCLRRRARPTKQDTKLPLAKWEIALRVVAVVLATAAVAQTALHLVTPRLQISESTLKIARRSLLAPKWHEDFETLAAKPYWARQTLKTLLTHVELANYNVYELINWKVDKKTYNEYVLSPIIDTETDPELNWRRPLWEYFYPRIRKEDTPEAAAEIVVRNLRERVSIDPRFSYATGVESVWKNQVTTPAGFERIYVATLRSVGVGARLNEHKAAEYWTGEEWRTAPRPVVETWLQ